MESLSAADIRRAEKARLELPLYRAWFAQTSTPQYELVHAESSDAVYRSYKKKRRELITRVELVPSSSTARACEAIGQFLRLGSRAPTRKRTSIRGRKT